MEDYFGRKLEEGDTIIWMPSEYKEFDEAKVTGFGTQFGKPYAQTDNGRKSRVHRGFIIKEKANGDKFTWVTNGETKL